MTNRHVGGGAGRPTRARAALDALACAALTSPKLSGLWVGGSAKAMIATGRKKTPCLRPKVAVASQLGSTARTYVG